MAKPLTIEEQQLVIELRERREELHEKAQQKYKQMIAMYQKYTKIKNSHDYFVNEHNRVDRKLFLLTPGITMLARKEREEKRAKKQKPITSNTKLIDALGEGAEDMLKALIAKKKRKTEDG